MHFVNIQTHKLLLDSFEREYYRSTKTDRFALHKNYRKAVKRRQSSYVNSVNRFPPKHEDKYIRLD